MSMSVDLGDVRYIDECHEVPQSLTVIERNDACSITMLHQVLLAALSTLKVLEEDVGMICGPFLLIRAKPSNSKCTKWMKAFEQQIYILIVSNRADIQ
jgi:hypothetical protein